MFVTNQVLKKVRNENQIFVTATNYFKESFSARNEFKYPKASIPNQNISEITGGQIVDSIAVSGYLLLANAILESEKVVGITYPEYLEALFDHRLNFTTLNVKFKKPVQQLDTFSIETKLIPLSKFSYNKKIANGVLYFSNKGTGTQSGIKVFSFLSKATLRPK